ncbi:MAG TPA: glycosyltransferase family 4 protein [Gammaproteobacteria bacterium]|nr:glycosyltransferase family 4 protein [Gammaproteobacteria bacterium]
MSDAPLRVLLSDPVPGLHGQSRYVWQLARRLHAAGHAVFVATARAAARDPAVRAAPFPTLAGFHFAHGADVLGRLDDVRRFRSHIRELRPDIVHLSHSQDHWAAAVANALLGHPARLLRTRHIARPVRDSRSNRLLLGRWTDLQIAVCESLRASLAAHRAIHSERVAAVHNGVDTETFRPDAGSRARTREELGYSDSDFVLGIAARLWRYKRHDLLLHAVARARATCPNLHLLVIGDGPDGAALEGLARELGIADVVRFQGPVAQPRMPDFHRALDAGVLPSSTETSSFSVKEHMATALPVIVSDADGLPEIVTHCREGLVFRSGQLEPLALALCTLAGNPRLRARLGAAARERARREFSVETFLERTLACYRLALSLPPSHDLPDQCRALG